MQLKFSSCQNINSPVHYQVLIVPLPSHTVGGQRLVHNILYHLLSNLSKVIYTVVTLTSDFLLDQRSTSPLHLSCKFLLRLHRPLWVNSTYKDFHSTFFTTLNLNRQVSGKDDTSLLEQGKFRDVIFELRVTLSQPATRINLYKSNTREMGVLT